MRLLFWSILCLSLVIVGEVVAVDRAVRSLAFRKGSSFFARMNFKITMFPYSTIFAQAAGFKMVWELPAGGSRSGRSISDIHEAAELLYESQGFDGRSCLLKNLCQTMEYVGQRDGVIGKIFKLLVGSYANNGNSTADASYCGIRVRNCPLHFIYAPDDVPQSCSLLGHESLQGGGFLVKLSRRVSVLRPSDERSLGFCRMEMKF